MKVVFICWAILGLANIAVASQCTMENNTDAAQTYYKKTAAQSSADCCSACSADPDCLFANWADATCYMKKATVLNRKSKSGVTLILPSGKPAPNPGPPAPPSPPSPPPAPPAPPLPAPKYDVKLLSRSPLPTLSNANIAGHGASPCTTTFNPAFIAATATSPSGVVVRTDTCTATQGRLSFAPCNLTTGVCGDLQPHITLPPDQGTQDPRIIFQDGWFYNFAYGENSEQAKNDGCTDGTCTVILARSQTPLNTSSWQHIGTYPWHRNGCCILRPTGQKSYCIFGEGPSPLPGLGIAMTTDISSGKFTQVNWTSGVINNNSPWLLPLGSDQQEVKLEAGTHIMELSSGDLIHFYAAATPGWVPNGNYTAGYVILDKDDPTKIIQRHSGQWLIPYYEFETLCGGATDCKYHGERKNVIFLCSATPLGNDTFRLFWGGGDGNVGTGVVQVTPL
eukprot:m.57738 g.57738  ORF g.57738 m.57738 type:complete len:451 (+) comp11128_c0_seq1:75-1427(+)